MRSHHKLILLYLHFQKTMDSELGKVLTYAERLSTFKPYNPLITWTALDHVKSSLILAGCWLWGGALARKRLSHHQILFIFQFKIEFPHSAFEEYFTSKFQQLNWSYSCEINSIKTQLVFWKHFSSLLEILPQKHQLRT